MEHRRGLDSRQNGWVATCNNLSTIYAGHNRISNHNHRFDHRPAEGTAAPRARGVRRLLDRQGGPSASGGPTRCSRRAAAPATSEAGILRPKRLVMPNLMATPFFSDRVCGSIASCILESRHNFAYVWLVIDDEQAVLHAVVPGRGSTLGSSGEFDSSDPLDAVQSCSFG